jgi:3-hydroxyisobutyrate dehydrogenase/2-hydroxy-3-oxopropionate reductase
VAQRADIVLMSVTTTDAVGDVVEGALGILSVAKPRLRVLVDHSTTEIGRTRELAAKLAAHGATSFVDAPVSGGPAAAEAGSLAIMAGGEQSAIDFVRPVMEKLGRFTHMGGVGAGQATKLVNQTLVLTNYCVMAEALRLAEAYGVDAARSPHALATGHAGSNLLPVLFERMIARDFTPKGYARQVLKDLEMLNSAAKNQHLAMPMSTQALTLFRMLVAQGKSELDGTAVLTLLPEVTPESGK